MSLPLESHGQPRVGIVDLALQNRTTGYPRIIANLNILWIVSASGFRVVEALTSSSTSAIRMEETVNRTQSTCVILGDPLVYGCRERKRYPLSSFNSFSILSMQEFSVLLAS